MHERSEEEFVHARKPGFEVRLCNPLIELMHNWRGAGEHLFKPDPKPTCPDCINILEGN